MSRRSASIEAKHDKEAHTDVHDHAFDVYGDEDEAESEEGGPGRGGRFKYLAGAASDENSKASELGGAAGGREPVIMQTMQILRI